MNRKKNGFHISEIKVVKESDKDAVVTVRVYKDTVFEQLYLYLQKNESLSVSFDLSQNFKDSILTLPETEKEILNRLAKKLSDKYGKDVRIESGLKKEGGVEMESDSLYGVLNVRFVVRIGVSNVSGLYVEKFSSEHGKWSLVSENLFESTKGQ